MRNAFAVHAKASGTDDRSPVDVRSGLGEADRSAGDAMSSADEAMSGCSWGALLHPVMRIATIAASEPRAVRMLLPPKLVEWVSLLRAPYRGGQRPPAAQVATPSQTIWVLPSPQASWQP